tara:strand:- start:243 stop:812 length:570 start_codon:yes stop_codon:yes gene_type:complete
MKSNHVKINYDHQKHSNEINNAMLFFILQHGSEQEKKDIVDKGKDKGVDKVDIAKIQLKPDHPKFVNSPQNIKKKRLDNVPKEKQDRTLHFFDLFDLVKMKCLRQFGLPEISKMDLLFNNVQQAFLVVNAKGQLVNIITNKSANKKFVQNLFNLKLENSILNLNMNNKSVNNNHKYKNPFQIKKPSPFN